MRRPRNVFCAVLASGSAYFVSHVAAAQVSTAAPSITQSSGQLNPLRLVNGATASSRPQNLNPLGINLADCLTDMTLQFDVIASGFDGTQLVQVWAGTADCTSDISRGVGATPSCWLVTQSLAGITVGSGASLPITFNVRAQDLVGHQQSVPTTPTYSRVGSAGCQAQTVDTAQKISVFFIPTDSSGHAISGSHVYSYAVTTDLVGPPAPASPSLAVGDTLFVVNWTPNSDADTAGYDVYIDPYPGQEGATSGGAGPEPTLVCSGSGVDAASGSGDAADAATADATTADDAAADASCVYVQTGGSGQAGSCGSTLLTSDAGSSVAVDSEGGTTTSGAGTSNLPPNLLLVGGGGISSPTVSDKSSGSYTISGLQNSVRYTVVVASIDGSGNVGPPTGQVCDSPAPVNDFFATYRQAGGTAGGGFCALESPGRSVPLGGAFVLLLAAGALVKRRGR
ncbi:MAG: hypothetical protein M3O50_16140 [Myxococcota bacterium]|nr:hypothetical protein [Myxococcota bacterium]